MVKLKNIAFQAAKTSEGEGLWEFSFSLFTASWKILAANNIIELLKSPQRASESKREQLRVNSVHFAMEIVCKFPHRKWLFNDFPLNNLPQLGQIRLI